MLAIFPKTKYKSTVKSYTWAIVGTKVNGNMGNMKVRASSYPNQIIFIRVILSMVKKAAKVLRSSIMETSTKDNTLKTHFTIKVQVFSSRNI